MASSIKVDELNSFFPDEKRRKEIIDRVAKIILDLKMEEFAEATFDMYGRFEVLGQSAYTYIAPYMAVFFGNDGLDAAEIFSLEPRQGSAMILERLRELKAERAKEKLEREDIRFTSRVRSWISEKLSRLRR